MRSKRTCIPFTNICFCAMMNCRLINQINKLGAIFKMLTMVNIKQCKHSATVYMLFSILRCFDLIVQMCTKRCVL